MILSVRTYQIYIFIKPRRKISFEFVLEGKAIGAF